MSTEFPEHNDEKGQTAFPVPPRSGRLERFKSWTNDNPGPFRVAVIIIAMLTLVLTYFYQ